MKIDFTNVEFMQAVLLIGLFALAILLLIFVLVLIFHIIYMATILKLIRIELNAKKEISKEQNISLTQREFNINDYDDIKNNAKTIIKNLKTIQQGNYENVTGVKDDLQISVDYANAILKKFDKETYEGDKL